MDSTNEMDMFGLLISDIWHSADAGLEVITDAWLDGSPQRAVQGSAVWWHQGRKK